MKGVVYAEIWENYILDVKEMTNGEATNESRQGTVEKRSVTLLLK